MKTKAQIVQELLEKKLITVEDAVTLLMADSPQQPIFIYPTYPIFPQPVYPSWPWPHGPFVTYCGTSPIGVTTVLN